MSAGKGSAIVFGGFGAIGAAISLELRHGDFAEVIRTSRGAQPHDESALTIRDDADLTAAADQLPTFGAAVWAQGMNVNDSVDRLSRSEFDQVMEANVAFVATTLAALVMTERLAANARVVVVGSMWQSHARRDKFSYTVSKAAVGGLVRAAALDLAPRGVLVNAVLPGVVDTPMSRSMLTTEQMETAASANPHHRLVRPDEVARVVAFLASPLNTAITGQSVPIDLGMTIARAL
jgi:NAD(P)-dependent dehydrogenase (short-subunit alcohol dehydrogenase family)